MKLLRKILYREQSRRHLIFAVSGTVAGLVLLLSGLHFYIELKGVFQENRDLLDPEYIVINKKVSMGQTLGLSSGGFRENEIEELEEQDFADEVAPFLSNQFPVSAYTRNQKFPDFYTELFFEAIPDRFVDVKDEDWSWNPDKGLIPVIVPQDYLNLYNFGFAPSQGLPKIPKGVVSLVDFKIRLKGQRQGQYQDFDGQIVGFSNRVSSILVPLDFLEWANEEFGYFKQHRPSKLILVSKDPTDPALVKYLDEHGYDTIREKLKSSRMNVILRFVGVFLVVIAFLIIGLAFLVFMLSLQLMISRSSERIIRLHKLGLDYMEISRPYQRLLLRLMGLTGLLALAITILLSRILYIYANNWNLELSPWPGGLIYSLTAGLLILISLANILAIRVSTRKLCS